MRVHRVDVQGVPVIMNPFSRTWYPKCRGTGVYQFRKFHFQFSRTHSCPALQERGWAVGVWAALALVLLLVHPGLCRAQATQLLRIGTAGTGGVYHPIGKLIAHGITSLAPGPGEKGQGRAARQKIVGVAQSSGGSVSNAGALAAGEIEAGLIQADVASWAFHGEGVFAGNEKVRAVRGIASLYPEKLQIVTRRDAGVRSVPDFRGKRISIDEIGSGTLTVMRAVLDACGLSEKDFSPVYLKPEFTIEKMRSGEIQGFVVMAGTPADSVKQIEDIGLFLVPIAPDVMRRINAHTPFLVPGEIPEGVYQGVPATPTLKVHALLAVNAAMNADLAYRLTEALWSDRTVSLLRAGHPQGMNIRRETALQGLSIPLHPGAERYYKEKGLLSKESPTP